MRIFWILLSSTLLSFAMFVGLSPLEPASLNWIMAAIVTLPLAALTNSTLRDPDPVLMNDRKKLSSKHSFLLYSGVYTSLWTAFNYQHNHLLAALPWLLAGIFGLAIVSFVLNRPESTHGADKKHRS